VCSELETAVANLATNFEKVLQEPELLRADPDGFRFGLEMVAEAHTKAFGQSTGTQKAPNPNVITYYDFEAKGFRTLKRGSLTKVIIHE
jgi:hypothetical protein